MISRNVKISEEGAGDHFEMFNRSLLNRRVFDWLDTTFALAGGPGGAGG